ncbi:MAG TPA: DNA polymerase III subunit gamma/tau, partial [Chthoniobacterales bacterium]|nr:DNA polymerase III subunit gamma/tau [Chthoniobacterales bacterium]
QEVVGQEHITQTLQNAITTGRLAQAYLFVGPRGVGKTSTARIFAKALNCHQGPTINPCGTCDACLEIAEGRSLDVLEIDGASNNSVESIRTLRENAAFSPARGPYKIYLIDEVHMLTTAAFNALLKTLEEPPQHVKFLFATTEAQKVPATITSRCQRFDLRRLSEKSIEEHLLYIASKENVQLSPQAAAALARGADGALRDAESMFDQVISFCGMTITEENVQHIFGFTPSEIVHQLGAALFAYDASTALNLITQQSQAGKDLSLLLGDLIRFLRDILIEKVQPSTRLLSKLAYADEVQGVDGAQKLSVQKLLDASSTGATTQFAAEVELGKKPTEIPAASELSFSVSSEKLLTLLDYLGETEGRLRWTTDKKLQLDVAVIKAVHLLQEVSLSDVLDVLSSIRGDKPLPSISATPKKPTLAEPSSTKIIAELPKKAPVKPPSISVSSDQISKPPLPVSETVIVSSAPDPSPILPVIEHSVEFEDTFSETLPSEREKASHHASDPWHEVASSLASESRLKFGWLETGKFLEHAGNKIVVEFPSSLSSQTETLFWHQAHKKIQECLSKSLDQKIEFTPRFTGEELPEELIEEPLFEERPVIENIKKNSPQVNQGATNAPSSSTNSTPPSLTPEELEHFKNDPLIKKALEIFRAEIV